VRFDAVRWTGLLKIAIGQMRSSGVRGLLVYCAIGTDIEKQLSIQFPSHDGSDDNHPAIPQAAAISSP
jgi:hypothetical protein